MKKQRHDNVKKILTQFNSNHVLYQDFILAVRYLLESILKEGKYKYQMNQRIKDRASLVEKIERKKIRGKEYKEISDIEDIIGVRIVFYTETDRKRFKKALSKALGKDIKIEETSKVSGYRSTHAIITFGNERTSLSEYKRFKGLKCEVQMTMILNHAWAEVEHDILYKHDSSVSKMDEKSYRALKDRMEKVMSNYIQKASSELETIVKKIRKFKEKKNKKKEIYEKLSQYMPDRLATL